MYLLIDQFGQKTIIEDIKRKTIKEEFCGGRVDKMYVDGKDGNTYHVGFVVGQGRGNCPLWLSVFKCEELRVKQ